MPKDRQAEPEETEIEHVDRGLANWNPLKLNCKLRFPYTLFSVNIRS